MKAKISSLMIIVLLSVISVDTARAGSENSQEYKVKAAFLYNFIKFVEWPEEKVADSNSITIGIIGKNPFGKAFEPLKDKQVKDKKVIVKYIKSFEESKQSIEQIETLRNCHILFVCRSENERLNKIIKSVEGHSVLTVGDMEDFLESGGIINFLKEEEKVCFEIHNKAAKQEEIDIRSKLLRLAKRTINEIGLLMNQEKVVARMYP